MKKKRFLITVETFIKTEVEIKARCRETALMRSLELCMDHAADGPGELQFAQCELMHDVECP